MECSLKMEILCHHLQGHSVRDRTFLTSYLDNSGVNGLKTTLSKTWMQRNRKKQRKSWKTRGTQALGKLILRFKNSVAHLQCSESEHKTWQILPSLQLWGDSSHSGGSRVGFRKIESNEHNFLFEAKETMIILPKHWTCSPIHSHGHSCIHSCLGSIVIPASLVQTMISLCI